MADDLTVKVDDVQEILERTATRARDGMHAGIDSAASVMEARLRDVIRSTFRSGKGDMARSVRRAAVELDGDTSRAEVSVDAAQAKLLDEGGTVRARSGPLKVPLSAAAKGGHQISGLFSVRSRRGNVLLAERTPSGIKPHYALKQSVTVHGQGYVNRATRDAREDIADAVATGIRDELGGA